MMDSYWSIVSTLQPHFKAILVGLLLSWSIGLELNTGILSTTLSNRIEYRRALFTLSAPLISRAAAARQQVCQTCPYSGTSPQICGARPLSSGPRSALTPPCPTLSFLPVRAVQLCLRATSVRPQPVSRRHATWKAWAMFLYFQHSTRSEGEHRFWPLC